jgi:hypothetical protein
MSALLTYFNRLIPTVTLVCYHFAMIATRASRPYLPTTFAPFQAHVCRLSPRHAALL